jgi:purine-nucleoside phosphorylase
MDKSRSIIPPMPFRGFQKNRLIYIPVDVPSGLIKKYLRKRAGQEKATDWGSLYSLEHAAVLFQAVGAPLAVLSLERLAVSGAKDILILGFCGSLSPDYKLGSAVSITKACAAEGTSGHYCPGQKIFRASLPLQKSIENGLTSRKLSFLRGATASMDAPFRETPAWLRIMRQKGMDVVDMEASAVFALARFRRLQAAALMIVSDELFSGRWTNGFSDPRLSIKAQDYFFPFLEGRSF